jgi:hypothetical protein|tara:strand:+ start:5029 stop:6015 length:987 start_codon:yes stop_codon:yes gene_type:complete
MKRQINLADVDNSLNSLTTTYAGQFAGQYISAALLSGATIANGGITVKPNIKYKEVIKKGAWASVVKDATCDFDLTADALTLTERIIQPEEFQVNLQFCKKDFRGDWDAIQMGISAYDNLAPSFSDYILAQVAAQVAQKTEQTIWEGTNGTAGEFDGFVTLMKADGDISDITGTTVNSTNVIGEMGKVVDAIPSAVYGKEDLHLYVSSNVARAYVRALGGFAAIGNTNFHNSNNGVDNKGTTWWSMGQALAFDGVKVFVCPGMGDNTMVAAEKSNLYFGTGLLSDSQEVRMIDTSATLGDQNVRVIMRYTAGVQYGIGSDIVLYEPGV